MTTDAAPALTAGRSLALAVCAALFTVAGWLVGTGAGRLGGNGAGAWYAAGGALLLVVAVWSAVLLSIGDLTESKRGLVPFETVVLAALGLGLLGWSFADAGPWAPAGALIVLALGAVLTARGTRLRNRDVAAYRHRRDHGVSVPGTVIDLEGPAGRAEDGRPVITLTVRYTAGDGAEYTERVGQEFPVYDVPRRGDTVTVRHLPEDPRSIDVRLPGPWAES